MYKVQVECDEPCELLLMSKSEIKTIRNNKGKVTNPDQLEEKGDKTKLSNNQIETLIKALESIVGKKESNKENCLAINRLSYENYSCYVDSVLFTLFSFSTKFVESYLLFPDMNDIEKKVKKTLLDGEKLTEEEVKKVMDYVKKINLVLVEINNHFRGIDRLDYCRTLRPILLKDPLMILEKKPEYVFAKKDQEDAGELIQALFKTFFIDTITSNTIKSFSNSENESFPEIIRSINSILTTPFFVFSPKQLQDKQIILDKEYINELEQDDYYFGDQSKNSKFISNTQEVNRLKKLQLISILKLIFETLKKNKKFQISSLSQFMDLVNLVRTNKDDEIVEKYTLEQINELYKLLKDILGPYYTDTLAPLIKRFKKDKTSVYYTAGEEIIKSHTVYYDIFTEREIFELEDNDNNKLLVINVKRFDDLNKKDNTAIQIPKEMIINGNVLTLNQMIIHSGSSVSKGHYTVRFRCNDNWYLYDDMGPTVKEVGTFEKLISDQNEFIKKNCSILIYSDIDPTI